MTTQKTIDAMKRIRATLHSANVRGLIADTIWHSPTETLFDFVDAAIEHEEAQVVEPHRFAMSARRPVQANAGRAARRYACCGGHGGRKMTPQTTFAGGISPWPHPPVRYTQASRMAACHANFEKVYEVVQNVGVGISTFEICDMLHITQYVAHSALTKLKKSGRVSSKKLRAAHHACEINHWFATQLDKNDK